MTLNLNGLIPATVLPMHADGSIDEPALRRYIGWVAGQGPVALAINVDTGEGPHLTHDEKVRVLRIVREVTDLPIVAGLAGPSTDAAVRQATDFKAAGADALLVFPIPAYLSQPLDPASRSRYHDAIAQVGLPLILFQLQPALAGLNYEADTLRAMAAVDGVVAIKEASFDARRFVDTARLRGAAQDDHAPDRQRQLHPRVVHARRDWRAHRLRRGHDPRAGRHDPRLAGRAHRRGHGARPPRPAPRRRRLRAPVGDYRVRLKECLRILGVLESAHVRRPLLPLGDAERSPLADVLTEVGLLPSGAAGAWRHRARAAIRCR